MSLKIRRLFDPKKTIGYAIEDPETGHFFDFQTRQFDQNPDNSIQDLVEDWVVGTQGGPANLRFLRGAYANVDPNDRSIAQLDTPRGVFRAGPYTIYFIDRSDVDRAVKIESWVADLVGDKLEFRPQEATPLVVVAHPDVPPPAPSAGTGTTFNINIPPNFRLTGDLGVGVDLTRLPGPNGGPDQPAPAPLPPPEPAPAPAPAPAPPPAPAPVPSPVPATPPAPAQAGPPPAPEQSLRQPPRGVVPAQPPRKPPQGSRAR